jgi:hypothetical protein
MFRFFLSLEQSTMISSTDFRKSASYGVNRRSYFTRHAKSAFTNFFHQLTEPVGRSHCNADGIFRDKFDLLLNAKMLCKKLGASILVFRGVQHPVLVSDAFRHY